MFSAKAFVYGFAGVTLVGGMAMVFYGSLIANASLVSSGWPFTILGAGTWGLSFAARVLR